MGQTPLFNLRYPEPTQQPDVPTDIHNLALDTEAAIQAHSGGGATVLGDTTLASPDTSISLSGLNLSAWKIVRLHCFLRHTTANEGGGNWERAIMRFNDDATGANYLWEVINADGSTVSNENVGYAAGIEAGHMTGPNFAVGFMGQNTIELVMPGATGMYKVSHLIGANIPIQSHALGTVGTGTWLNTGPITKVSIFPNEIGTNIAAGSRMFLVGLY